MLAFNDDPVRSEHNDDLGFVSGAPLKRPIQKALPIPFQRLEDDAGRNEFALKLERFFGYGHTITFRWPGIDALGCDETRVRAGFDFFDCSSISKAAVDNSERSFAPACSVDFSFAPSSSLDCSIPWPIDDWNPMSPTSAKEEGHSSKCEPVRDHGKRRHKRDRRPSCQPKQLRHRPIFPANDAPSWRSHA